MAKPKKESVPISMRMDAKLYQRLTDYCEASGQSKTIAIERAVSKYIDAYNDLMKRVAETADRTADS